MYARSKTASDTINKRQCLSGNSHILMANGNYKLLKDLEVGEDILAWNGAEFIPDKVKKKSTIETTKTINVQSPRYLSLTSSMDYVFATTWCGRNTVQWKKASDLGTYSLLLNYAGIAFPDKSNADLAEFYGYMLSDGYVSHYQQPKFTNKNEEILRRVELLAIKLFNCKVIRREKGNCFDLGLSNGTRGGGSTPNPIKELFRKDGLDVSDRERRLPPILWKLDENSIGRFFAAFISGDGSIYCHKKGFTANDTGHLIPPAIEVSIHCGLSHLIAWDIYWLLRKMGIIPHIPVNERGRDWKIRISKGVDIKKLLSFGPIYGKQQKQQEALIQAESTTKKVKLWKGCFRSRFKIFESESEQFFDIKTEKYHNFIANGYVVRNG